MWCTMSCEFRAPSDDIKKDSSQPRVRIGRSFFIHIRFVESLEISLKMHRPPEFEIVLCTG